MYPLGASYDGAGVNFALYSQVAQKVELCLFDEHDVETQMCIRDSPKEHGHLGKPCIYVDTPRKRKLHSPTRRYLTGRVRSRYS